VEITKKIPNQICFGTAYFVKIKNNKKLPQAVRVLVFFIVKC